VTTTAPVYKVEVSPDKLVSGYQTAISEVTPNWCHVQGNHAFNEVIILKINCT
jgi:hypothetical protein